MPFAAAAAPVGDRELSRPVQVERRRAPLGEDLEGQRVGVPVGDPGHREGADRAAGECRGEGGDVLVLHRLPHSLTGTPPAWPTACPSGTGRSFTVVEERAADRADRAAEELAEVDQVAADVGQRPATRAAAVAPAHRGVGVGAVVAPVAAVEVHDRAEARRR